MFAPIRTLTAYTRESPAPLLASAAAVTVLFSATPFLIPAIADRFGVGRGDAGVMSMIQVGSFAIATLVLPRVLQPSGRLFRGSLVLLAIANVAAALAPSFPAVLSTRILSGAAAGLLTWIGWAAAMGSKRGMTAMSAVGPMTALVVAPVLGLLVEWGDRVVFVVLAVAVLPVLVMPLPTIDRRPRPGERSRSRSNRILLAALFLLTFAGAGLFVYEAVVAVDMLGMTPLTASLGFSLNAGAGFVGARLSTRHRRPGVWLASGGPAALLSVVGGSAAWFYIGMAWWGFAFWMGLPGVLEMLVARSLRPDERAGDAQALMAFGRSLGPGFGGLMVDGGSLGALAVATGAGLALSGVIVVGVQEGREALPPTDPRTVRP